MKKLIKKYLKGLRENYFPFNKYSIAGERLNDPVYHCDVYKEKGCSHVDGLGCHLQDCNILDDYKIQKIINTPEEEILAEMTEEDYKEIEQLRTTLLKSLEEYKNSKNPRP